MNTIKYENRYLLVQWGHEKKYYKGLNEFFAKAFETRVLSWNEIYLYTYVLVFEDEQSKSNYVFSYKIPVEIILSVLNA